MSAAASRATRKAPCARTLIFCAIAGMMIASSPANAMGEPSLKRAIDRHDLKTLEYLAAKGPNGVERALARGSILAMRHKDQLAESILRRAAASARAELRAVAYRELSKIYLRQSRFREAFEALSEALRLTTEPVDLDTRQTLAFTKALRAAEPMHVVRPGSGALAIRRDAAGLARVTVGLGDVDQDVVIDTGAGFSTVTRSLAERLGIGLLPDEVEVASGSQPSVKARLGLLKTLRFGNAVVSNVVFIIVPDEALSFAGGAYTIDAIIGLPVFLALNRLEFDRSASGESLGYGPSGRSVRSPNMLLEGVEPIVLLKVPGGASPLRLFIDTGGAKTLLYASALETNPALSSGAVKDELRLGGAGGALTDVEAMKVPTVVLEVQGKVVRLSDVSVMSKAPEDRDGAIGQDLLQKGGGFVLDFDNMEFDIKSSSSPAAAPLSG